MVADRWYYFLSGWAARQHSSCPVIAEIARKHGKTAAQTMVFNFELTAEQLSIIDALGAQLRGGPESEAIALETFSMPIPEA